MNFLTKFPSNSKNLINYDNLLSNNYINPYSNSSAIKDPNFPKTTKNSTNTTSTFITGNELTSISNQKFHKTLFQSTVSPKNDEIKFKENLASSEGFKNIKNFSQNIETPQEKANPSNKFAYIKHSKNSLANNTIEKAVIPDDKHRPSPKEFACCNIYNDHKIQDKLVKYTKTQGLNIKQVIIA
jgi:hypothetical protein